VSARGFTFGFLVRYQEGPSRHIRVRLESGFSMQSDASRALEAALEAVERQEDGFVVEAFVATFAWDGVTIRDLCEPE